MLNKIQHDFMLEQWLEYAIGQSVFLLRFYARWKTHGFAGYSWDDLFAGLSMVFYTLDPALLQVVITHGSFVGLNEESAQALDPATIESLRKGSKALFAAWFTYVSLIWTLKGQVLGYYDKLTTGTREHKWVKVMAVVCFLSWLSLMLLIFCRCTPIQKNWQIVPYAGDKCTRTESTVIALMVLNIFNDICLVLIPAHLLWFAQIPLRRKLLIALLLSSSFFIITCALLRGILGLQSINNIVISIQWGTRETFVTIIVICVPPIKPLFSKRLKESSSFGQSSHGQKPIQLHETDPERHVSPVKDIDNRSFGSSKDLILEREGSKVDASVDYSRGISVTTEYEVSDAEPLSKYSDDGQEGTWSRQSEIKATGGKRPS
ncbi:hypothetical protein MPH_04854 [Macrophomina phaseolina MS6]|uniref:Rhodopsin domain-containing protein n=1 Tax=Macrophomina phaseolina (strain MS6) TaxID=1126212 RepID=K2SMB6_MACPH|nr:hypothetical protein MPH_04854 [Macrophomina phaseolina MS6]